MVEVRGDNYCGLPHTADVVFVELYLKSEQTQYPQCEVPYSNYCLVPLPRFKGHSDSVIVIRDDSSVVINQL